jgi:hypothetical protein
MSRLKTQEMITIARQQKQAAAEAAFRVSGMATLLSEGRKPILQTFKVSPAEQERYRALATATGVNLSALIRAMLNQACDEMGVGS